jgi:predicted phosphodiesterase/pyruvate-formate lyase-activating enzyme
VTLSGEILVFGGCYSNLQAAQALRAQAAAMGFGPERMFCTGDIIAYGADAAATLHLIRDAGIASIAGNCERQLAAGAGDCGCGFAPGSACEALAADWYAHAQRQITDEDRAYMAGLPDSLALTLDGARLRLVHGNAERINAFVFPSASNLELARQIAQAEADVVVAGHSGIPFTRHAGRGLWVNAGSIGMPANDGTPRGWFATLRVVDGVVTARHHALSYDYKAAATAMRRARLPEGYAAAIATGIWPSLDILPGPERLRTGMPLEHAALPEPKPEIALTALQTLWINTGTLCNITCAGCFMESSPSNDALSYFTLADLIALLDEAPATLREIGFTGGEPFMNPEIMPMLQAVLARGLHALVLTNAMRPMQRHQAALARLLAAHPGQLSLRVSLDHFTADLHEALRGPGSFAPSLAGLRCLSAIGAPLSVAARTPWGQTEAMLRAGFAALFAAEGLRLNAQDQAELILFPEMDADSPLPPVTQAALAALPPDKPLMCANARMAVRRRGAAAASLTPCTLLPARELPGWESKITLDHPHCGRFCVYGGASCAGAPG